MSCPLEMILQGDGRTGHVKGDWVLSELLFLTDCVAAQTCPTHMLICLSRLKGKPRPGYRGKLSGLAM